MFNFLKSNKDETVTETQAQSFTDVRAEWKALASQKQTTKQDMAALCIYRSMIKNEGKAGAISRLQKSFKPITNTRKLENGAWPYGAMQSAVWLSQRSTFVSWLTADEQKALIAIAKDIRIAGKEIK